MSLSLSQWRKAQRLMKCYSFLLWLFSIPYHAQPIKRERKLSVNSGIPLKETQRWESSRKVYVTNFTCHFFMLNIVVTDSIDDFLHHSGNGRNLTKHNRCRNWTSSSYVRTNCILSSHLQSYIFDILLFFPKRTSHQTKVPVKAKAKVALLLQLSISG